MNQNEVLTENVLLNQPLFQTESDANDPSNSVNDEQIDDSKNAESKKPNVLEKKDEVQNHSVTDYNTLVTITPIPRIKIENDADQNEWPLNESKEDKHTPYGFKLNIKNKDETFIGFFDYLKNDIGDVLRTNNKSSCKNKVNIFKYRAAVGDELEDESKPFNKDQEEKQFRCIQNGVEKIIKFNKFPLNENTTMTVQFQKDNPNTKKPLKENIRLMNGLFNQEIITPDGNVVSKNTVFSSPVLHHLKPEDLVKKSNKLGTGKKHQKTYSLNKVFIDIERLIPQKPEMDKSKASTKDATENEFESLENQENHVAKTQPMNVKEPTEIVEKTDGQNGANHIIKEENEPLLFDNAINQDKQLITRHILPKTDSFFENLQNDEKEMKYQIENGSSISTTHSLDTRLPIRKKVDISLDYTNTVNKGFNSINKKTIKSKRRTKTCGCNLTSCFFVKKSHRRNYDKGDSDFREMRG